MVFTREQFADPDDEAGVFMSGLGAALVTWAAMQDRKMTVNEAAKAFNTTPEIIVEAVDDAMWISVENDGTLELDGA